jgi:hypothetical protein
LDVSRGAGEVVVKALATQNRLREQMRADLEREQATSERASGGP